VNKRGLLVIAAVVVIFAAVGGYVIVHSTSSGHQDVTVNLAVKGDTANRSEITVHHGDRVTMTVTADQKEEVHLHGYDIQFEVGQPNGSVTKTFTADKDGTFEYEIEATSTHLGDLKVVP
jgi:FtsP/CotA-like multicopper oxidase with cupredoxin domain